MPTSLEDVAAAWERWAQIDPLWAINTVPGKEGGRWDPAAFFASGERDVDDLLAGVTRAMAPDPPFLNMTGWALDFGCGVGRLSRYLPRYHAEVVGIDVSATMLQLARQFEASRPTPWPDGVLTFEQHLSGDLAFYPDNHFDAVYSLVTLQHLPYLHQLAYVREFLRVLAPGGVAAFGTMMEPLHPVAPQRASRDRPAMDMFGVSPSAVVREIRRAGGRVRGIEYDRGQSEWSSVWVGLRYYAQKDDAL